MITFFFLETRYLTRGFGVSKSSPGTFEFLGDSPVPLSLLEPLRWRRKVPPLPVLGRISSSLTTTGVIFMGDPPLYGTLAWNFAGCLGMTIS